MGHGSGREIVRKKQIAGRGQRGGMGEGRSMQEGEEKTGEGGGLLSHAAVHVAPPILARLAASWRQNNAGF
eukprot:1414155-Pyramimonas_sp.AAC.1